MKFLTLGLVFFVSVFSFAEETKQTFRIFGTEGPYSPMKEAADAFAASNNLKIEITSKGLKNGKPTPQKTLTLSIAALRM